MITDPATRAAVEAAYAAACSLVVVLARLLGRPSPLVSRAERRVPEWRRE